MQLVIAEKPSVANSIADVLGANERKDGYREGNGYYVSWCVGHLVELCQPQVYGQQYEKWSYDSLPIMPEEWKYEVKSEVKKQFGIVSKLMNAGDVSEVVCATDAGREGELIFRLAYNEARCNKPILRLWISSMEESAIRDGFNNLRPGSEYDNLYRSALARQQADWLVGINGTRLFTVLYKGKVLKVGRVQTPTLAMLVERETEIMHFKKKPFYTLVSDAEGLIAVSDKYETENAANQAKMSCSGQNATVASVKREDKSINPPKLFDLTSLQREANKLFGFTAKQTLEYTQNLYEKKLVTYPRTDSQFLSDDMADTASKVIAAIKEASYLVTPFDETKPDIARVLNSRKVTDHHAIIPTVEIAKDGGIDVTEAERKVLYLIAARLLEATGEKHEYVAETVVLSCNRVDFTCKGKVIKNNGWKNYSEALRGIFNVKKSEEESEDDETISGMSVSEGQSLKVNDISIKEQFTKAPAHYTEATLLIAMEKAGAADMDDDVERKGLGTPATRADIIEKLVKDGFVKREKKQMIPTDDGMKLITILPEMVKSPQLTADWENELVRVSKGEISMDGFMEGIELMVTSLVAQYKCISEKPMENNPFAKAQESFGACPKCGADVVKGKFGVYCSGKCGMTFGKAMGATLTDSEIKSLLGGKRILVKNLRGKSGKTYDAYLEPKGIAEYSYTDKEGNTKFGYQYQFDMTFPKRKKD